MSNRDLKQLASRWFEKGNHDLDVAKNEFNDNGWTDIICYH